MPTPATMLYMLRTAKLSSKKANVGFDGLQQRRADLTMLKQLAEAGQLRSVIDQCYEMDQIVEAYQVLLLYCR